MSARDEVLAALQRAGYNGEGAARVLDRATAEAPAADGTREGDLDRARIAAREVLLTETGTGRPQWRVVVTDSESPTGVAPVCLAEGLDDLHTWADLGHGVERLVDGVWDCCPFPQFETDSPIIAAYLVELLNTDGADRPAIPPLYAADYEGAELTLHLSPEAAREHCDDIAKAEARGRCWDWCRYEDVDRQFWTDPDTDMPVDYMGAVWQIAVEGSVKDTRGESPRTGESTHPLMPQAGGAR